MSTEITVEHNLLLTRAKSAGWISLGFIVCVLGFAFFALVVYRTDNLWFLLLAVGPGGYGWHLIAKNWAGLYRRVISDAPGTARWAKMEDLEKAGAVGKNVDPRRHIPCGLYGGKRVFDDSDRHHATLGSTRRGKGIALLVPALAQVAESFVVLDPSGELAAITLPERAKKGLTFVLNPFGVLTDTHDYLRSCGFNPYLNCSPGEPGFFARLSEIGESMTPRASINDSHWDEGSVQLTTVLGMWEKWLEKEGKVARATMRHVMEMLTYSYAGKGSKSLKGVMQAINAHPDRQMAKLATRFIADDDDKEVRGVLATTAGKTKFLNDETLLSDMDRHPTVDGKPFDFAMLKDRIITVYIILPDDMLRTHALWLRLVVSNAINALKRSPPGRVRPILLLDEIGNLGYMEPLDTSMGMIAKKGVKVWTVWQSLSQISRIYGDHGRETFLSGASLNSFRADDLETADYLSKRLGRRTEVASSYSLRTSETNNTSKTDSAIGFPLMHPDQIMALPPRTLISWIDRLPYPVMLDAPGYFDMPWIKGMAPNPYYVARKA